MIRSSNPVFNESLMRGAYASSRDDVMTIEGTINKTFVATMICAGMAYVAWVNPAFRVMVLPAVIAAFIVGIVLTFNVKWAPVLTPVYAACEGVLLGSISSMYEMAYSGIVVQAVLCTFGTLFAMLAVYRSGWIQVNDKLRAGLMTAMLSICGIYFVSFILGLFGMNMGFLYGSGLLSIGFSIVVIGVAAFSLLLDFDFIERASNSGSAPKYMEWYGAFGLLVTLVWVYIEVLRLLSKLRSER